MTVLKNYSHFVDLEDLNFDEGAALLIKSQLAKIQIGDKILLQFKNGIFLTHLTTWCRNLNCPLEFISDRQAVVTRSRQTFSQHIGAHFAGSIAEPVESALWQWGIGARGSLVEAGVPNFYFLLANKNEIWSKKIKNLYRRAAAKQWDPEQAIPWHTAIEHSDEIENAIVQIMTFLIENETAALIIPAKFSAQVHPHYYEAMQFLAIQAADEARHIEVFTRRATLLRRQLGFSSVSGQKSLKTLIDETDFSMASLLLSILGEGSFLSLLYFLRIHAPDAITRQVCRLAAGDEARHVSFAQAHLQEAVIHNPGLLHKMAKAIEMRHQQLSDSHGLNEEIFEALLILAAKDFSVAAIRRGHQAVKKLEKDMHKGRRHRLQKLGFSYQEAERLSSLHTKNFM